MSAQLTKYDYRSFQTNFDVKMALSRWPPAVNDNLTEERART